MITISNTVSALQSRIDAGLADPISDKERELVKELRKNFEKKYDRIKKP